MNDSLERRQQLEDNYVAQTQQLRDAWARFHPEIVEYFERMQDEEARAEGERHEKARRLKGSLRAILVSALGIGVFLALCLVWGRPTR